MISMLLLSLSRRQDFPNFIFAKKQETYNEKQGKQTKKRRVILFFSYLFGFARKEKSHFLTLLPSSPLIALHPVTHLYVFLYGPNGGTFRYPVDFPAMQCECSTEPTPARPHFIPFFCVVPLPYFLDWANILSQEF